MLRVLVLSEVWYPHGSGGQISTREFIKAWARLGVRVTVLTNQYPGEPMNETIDGYVIKRLRLFNNERMVAYKLLLRARVLADKVLREIQQNDVVYIASNWFWAAILGKRLGKPVVSHLHDYFTVCPLGGLFHTTQSQVCDGCGIFKGAVCINEDDQIKRYAGYERVGHLIALLGFSRPINTSIANYIDQFIFVSESHRRLVASVASNIAKRGAVVYNPPPPVRYKKPASLGFAYLGGSFYEKGYRVLLSALSIYKPPHPFVATKCDANAIALLGSLGVKAYPRVSWDDLERIKDSTHCLVFPSIWEEPLPNVFSEAMLSCKCVISSRIGSVMELAGNAEGITYVKPNSPTELAQAIQTVSSIPLENAVRLGQENRNRILDFYHDKNPPEDLLSIFESLAKR